MADGMERGEGVPKCPEPESCLRLAVLEERVAGLTRDREEARRWRQALETRVADIAAILSSLSIGMEQRLAQVEAAGWRQFWALALVIIGAVIGMSVWLSQQILGHIAATAIK